MKNGRNLADVNNLITHQHTAKRDFILPTTALLMEPTSDEHDVTLSFLQKGEKRIYAPTELCLDQISDRVGIPKKYADRMRREAPGLLAQNVNHWFKNEPQKRMLRTLNHGENVARAFLSDGYRPLDNYDLAAIALPKLEAAGCEIRSCEVTEKRFYIQASTPRIQAIIDQSVVVGTHNRIERTVQAGVIISNSEVGMGALYVEPIMFDLICTNGLIMQRALRKNHAGRRSEGGLTGDDNSFEMFSDETRKLDDMAFWNKVGDVITGSLDQISFNRNIDRLRETQKQTLAVKSAEIEEVVEVTASRFTFSEDEKANLRLHFAQGGDFSKYGLINAVTRTAEDCESYDRAVELERLGGEIIELAPSNFTKN